MIRLIDLPGVRALENEQVMFNRFGGDADNFQAKADAVSLALFSITREDAIPYGPDDDASDEEFAAWEELIRKWTGADLSGWDLNDDQGRELLITQQFIAQIIAAEMGWKGKMPDVTKAQAENWGAKLEAEARTFRPTRRTT